MISNGVYMGNNKDPNQKRPGEKEEGTFHYNPGNMSGKPIGAIKKVMIRPTTDKQDTSEQRDTSD